MKNAVANKPTHVVKGNVLDALGFSTSEASALKVKAEILSAILEHIRSAGYTQAQLVSLLDEYQPSVSNLLKGRIAQVSIEKLLRYADRLGLETKIAVRTNRGKTLTTQVSNVKQLRIKPAAPKLRPSADSRAALVG